MVCRFGKVDAVPVHELRRVRTRPDAGHPTCLGEVEIVPPAAAAAASPQGAAVGPVEPVAAGRRHEADDGGVEVGVGDTRAGVLAASAPGAAASCGPWTAGSGSSGSPCPVRSRRICLGPPGVPGSPALVLADHVLKTMDPSITARDNAVPPWPQKLFPRFEARRITELLQRSCRRPTRAHSRSSPALRPRKAPSQSTHCMLQNEDMLLCQRNNIVTDPRLRIARARKMQCNSSMSVARHE
jgi:hypothetical protein